MALSLEPTYITTKEFKAFTRVSNQRTMADFDIIPHILHAEQVIDSYIGYVAPANSTQNLKFPTLDDDGISEIPNDLAKACIEIVSSFISKGEPNSADGTVKKESWSSSGYSRELDISKVLDPTNESVSCSIPPLAKRLLRQWCSDTAPATY